jgi:hypothetical protein
VEGSFEHDNEPSVSVKFWEVAAQLASSQNGLRSTELVYRYTNMIGK